MMANSESNEKKVKATCFPADADSELSIKHLTIEQIMTFYAKQSQFAGYSNERKLC